LVTTTAKRPRGQPGGITTFPALLGHAFVWSQQNYSMLWKTVRFGETWGDCVHDPPEKNGCLKTNEQKTLKMMKLLKTIKLPKRVNVSTACTTIFAKAKALDGKC